MKEAKAARCHLNLNGDTNKSDTDEGRSFNVVIGFLQGASLISFTFLYFNPTKYTPLTETHFSSLEIHSVKAGMYAILGIP